MNYFFGSLYNSILILLVIMNFRDILSAFHPSKNKDIIVFLTFFHILTAFFIF